MLFRSYKYAMRRDERKATVAAYKERKVVAGIYAVRLAPSGAAWVGRTGDVEAIGNRLSFTLRQGGHACRSLQAAWNEHGAAALTVEILERIEEETTYARDAQLRDRLAVWRERLKAEVI